MKLLLWHNGNAIDDFQKRVNTEKAQVRVCFDYTILGTKKVIEQYTAVKCFVWVFFLLFNLGNCFVLFGCVGQKDF